MFQVSCNLSGYPKLGIYFTLQHEKQPSRLPSRSYSLGSSSRANSMSMGSVLPSKIRLRWTQDLHDKFVECVNRLGGVKSKHRLISSLV